MYSAEKLTSPSSQLLDLRSIFLHGWTSKVRDRHQL